MSSIADLTLVNLNSQPPEEVRAIAGVNRSIGSQEMDAYLQEQHSLSAEVTREPVEAGADVSDQVIQQPDELNIIAQISNHPPKKDDNTDPFRAESAFERLKQMKEAGEPVTVLTSLQPYDNMVITSITVERTARLSNVVRCTIHLVSVRIVRSGTVDVPEGIDRAKPKVDRGNQPAKEATPQESASFGVKGAKAAKALVGKGLDLIGF
jgi:hypothetical protein